MCFCGIDGYSQGWIGIVVNKKREYQRKIYLWQSTEKMLQESFKNFKFSLIDMPIGLNDYLLPGERNCDKLARRLIGWPRSSSIFIVPHREALSAKTKDGADKINLQICGKKLTFQAFNIARRIKALDMVFSKNPKLQSKIRESHPELCFWALNQKRALITKKCSAEGLTQRLRIISRYTPIRAKEFLEFAKDAGKLIKYDDIVDAMVLALSASLCKLKGIQSIPRQPQIDSRGLRMEMVIPDVHII